MKVLCVGGGSGGHVTPVLAVINELSQLDPSLEAHFVCDRAFEAQSRGLMKHASISVPVSVIHAGKFRRYHGVSVWKQLADLPTLLRNIGDIGLIVLGFFESLWLLVRSRPDVVFAKGGYVCLPLGTATALLRIPLVIHDSDTRAGLTNTVLSRFAVRIATGAPLENYNYPAARSVFTGVPIDPAFHPFTTEEQRAAKQSLGIIDLDKPLIVVTGGGLGAKSINDGTIASATRLLKEGYSIYHVTGKKQFESVKSQAAEHVDYHIVPFVYKDMAQTLGAADVVVSRGSATFLQELATLKKPTIIVPASHLGDQVKNAEVYRAADAAYIIDDTEASRGKALYDAITAVLGDTASSLAMATRFHAFAKQDAATDVAKLIYTAAAGKSAE